MFFDKTAGTGHWLKNSGGQDDLCDEKTRHTTAFAFGFQLSTSGFRHSRPKEDARKIGETKHTTQTMADNTLHETQPTSRLSVTPFRIPLASSSLPSISELQLENGSSGALGDNVDIVGTITMMGEKSAIVWIGWDNKRKPSMGPLVVAMPRSNYAGVGTNGEAPCSELIGSASEEDTLLAQQIASRLSRKTKMPVFVSTSLNYEKPVGIGGASVAVTPGEDFDFTRLAAAMAEKHVTQMLLGMETPLNS